MKQILWAPQDYSKDLLQELQRRHVTVLGTEENLFLIESDFTEFVWIEASALNAETLTFDSIGKARLMLRERAKLWTPAPVSHFRRSELIARELRTPPLRKRKFRESIPAGPLGVFCVVKENEMWVSPDLRPAVALPAWEFEESPEAPSRAYLKLWEVFTREGFAPKSGDTCLELGSAPGGWTWVLEGLGCNVIAVDKGEMDPKLTASKRVRWLRQDAFSLQAEKIGPVDWFFSDLICYPARLLGLVKEWSDKGLAKNFVCTLKFQGPTDFDVMDEFLRMPGSQALHLHHNRHEITWIWRPKRDAQTR